VFEAPDSLRQFWNLKPNAGNAAGLEDGDDFIDDGANQAGEMAEVVPEEEDDARDSYEKEAKNIFGGGY
jgi:hypothetical protein